jgi:hypothetical protein
LVLDAMARGVKVSLMLDIDSQDESRMIDDLVNMGMLGVPAPSCANERISVFASSHEKMIVIDDEWALVQSGNYSDNSIPLNEVDGGNGPAFRSGNRDTGLAIRCGRTVHRYSAERHGPRYPYARRASCGRARGERVSRRTGADPASVAVVSEQAVQPGCGATHPARLHSGQLHGRGA